MSRPLTPAVVPALLATLLGLVASGLFVTRWVQVERLQASGHYAETEPIWRHRLTMRQTWLGHDAELTGHAHWGLGLALGGGDDGASAMHYGEAVRILRRVRGDDDWSVQRVRLQHALALSEASAIEARATLLALLASPLHDGVRADALGVLARSEWLEGEVGAARHHADQSLALYATVDDPVGEARVLQLRSELLDDTAAVVDLRRALALRQQHLPAGDLATERTLERLTERRTLAR